MNLVQKGYTEGSPVYRVFEDFDARMYLSVCVMGYADQMVKNNGDVENVTERLENKSLVFPKMANALFLTMFGDFELFLISLCKAYKQTNGLKLKIDELTGSGIYRAFHYLDRVVEISDVKNNNYYVDLKHWNKIRNLLIHNSAIVPSEDEESVERLKIGTAKSLDNKIINMEFEDCKRFIETITKIQKNLIK